MPVLYFNSSKVKMLLVVLENIIYSNNRTFKLEFDEDLFPLRYMSKHITCSFGIPLCADLMFLRVLIEGNVDSYTHGEQVSSFSRTCPGKTLCPG